MSMRLRRHNLTRACCALVLSLVAWCLVAVHGCTNERRAAVTASTLDVKATTSAPTTGAQLVPTTGATPSKPEANGVTRTEFPFQFGQPMEQLLPGYTVGKVPVPDAAINAGLPEDPAEWDACLTAQANLRVDLAYPAVRLGRKVAVRARGEEMAMRLYPGLVRNTVALTGHGMMRPEPCWVGAWEKVSDEAYYDHVTDLTWRLETSRRLDWDGALQYVASLNASTAEVGWRMPTSAEQLTLAAAYEQWVFTRVRFGAVTSVSHSLWSADEPVGALAKPGFHTTLRLRYADITYAANDKAAVLAVRDGRWTPPSRQALPVGRVVPGQRHPDSRYPVPERVMLAGVTREPETVNQCCAALDLHYEHGVFPPVHVVETLSLRSEPRRTTRDELRKELLPFDFGVYRELPPSCLVAAIEPRGPNHFVEWVTQLEWQFLSEERDHRITFQELSRALKERNGQIQDQTAQWRLPTFVELAVIGGLTHAFWDFRAQKYRREPVWLSDTEVGQPANGRLCRDTDSGEANNAQQNHQGRCAALLVRAVN